MAGDATVQINVQEIAHASAAIMIATSRRGGAPSSRQRTFAYSLATTATARQGGLFPARSSASLTRSVIALPGLDPGIDRAIQYPQSVFTGSPGHNPWIKSGEG